METTKISKKMLKRLPLYLDYLRSLPENVENVSATTIARDLELGDVQVRKDLASVSAAGRQKVGRSRKVLIRDIETQLDLANKTGAVIVGAGKLGRALLEYRGFGEYGMTILAGFDVNADEKLPGPGKPVYPMNRLRSFCQTYAVKIGIITVPARHAQEICDRLVACGIKAIWNFAPVQLTAPEDVLIQNENLALSMTALRIQLRSQYE